VAEWGGKKGVTVPGNDPPTRGGGGTLTETNEKEKRVQVPRETRVNGLGACHKFMHSPLVRFSEAPATTGYNYVKASADFSEVCS